MSYMSTHYHRFLTVAEAAELLKVSERTVRRWIDGDAVPYLKLPGGGYRLPEGQMLASMSSSEELASGFASGDAATSDRLRDAAFSLEAERQARLAGDVGPIELTEDDLRSSTEAAMLLAGAARARADERRAA